MSKDFHVDVSADTLNNKSNNFLMVLFICGNGIFFAGMLILLWLNDAISITTDLILVSAAVTTVFAYVIFRFTQAKTPKPSERRHQDLIRNGGRLLSVNANSIEVLEEALRRDNFMKPSPRGWHDLAVGSAGYRSVMKTDIESLELRNDSDENNERFIALEWKLKNGKTFVLNVIRVMDLANIGVELRAQGYPFKSTVSKYP